MSPRTLIALASSVGLATLLGARTTRATLLVRSAAVERAGRGDGVIVGRVESARAEWSGLRIVTRSLVTTEKTLTGTFAPSFEIVTPGGTIDGVAMRVLGAPVLGRGTRAVMFLAHERPGTAARHILDLADGALMIERGSDGIDRVLDAGRSRTVDELTAELAR